jgi:hypothetical protein
MFVSFLNGFDQDPPYFGHIRMFSCTFLTEKVVVEMGDYTKGDLCRNDLKLEINENIFDSCGLEINKSELSLISDYFVRSKRGVVDFFIININQI